MTKNPPTNRQMSRIYTHRNRVSSVYSSASDTDPDIMILIDRYQNKTLGDPSPQGFVMRVHQGSDGVIFMTNNVAFPLCLLGSPTFQSCLACLCVCAFSVAPLNWLLTGRQDKQISQQLYELAAFFHNVAHTCLFDNFVDILPFSHR